MPNPLLCRKKDVAAEVCDMITFSMHLKLQDDVFVEAEVYLDGHSGRRRTKSCRARHICISPATDLDNSVIWSDGTKEQSCSRGMRESIIDRFVVFYS